QDIVAVADIEVGEHLGITIGMREDEMKVAGPGDAVHEGEVAALLVRRDGLEVQCCRHTGPGDGWKVERVLGGPCDGRFVEVDLAALAWRQFVFAAHQILTPFLNLGSRAPDLKNLDAASFSKLGIAGLEMNPVLEPGGNRV